jgi:hypothetical protein
VTHAKDMIGRELQFKAAESTARPASAAANKPSAELITGQVFITTRGAGAYKFAGATVYAFHLGELDSVKSMRQVRRISAGSVTSEITAWDSAFEGRTPLATARTDADGKFQLSISGKPAVFLACHASRRVGGREEHNFWLVPVTGGSVNLDNENSETL